MLEFLTIGEAGSKEFVVVNKNVSLYSAIREIDKAEKDRALVFENKQLIGIITKKDIVSRIITTKSRRLPPTALHVSSVMSYPLIKLPAETLVVKASRVMLEKGISSIPALRNDNVESLFSKWDIARLLTSEASPISSLMSSEVVTVHEDDSLIKIRKLIIEDDYSALPVLSSDNRIVGIVTIDELAKALIELTDILSEGGAKDALRRVTARDIMRPAVPALLASDAIGMAAALMIEKGLRGFIVSSRGGELVGIITLTDLTRFVARRGL